MGTMEVVENTVQIWIKHLWRFDCVSLILDIPSSIFVHNTTRESCINPLRAKFFRGNTNIYLHFMSLLHIDMTQVLKILPQVTPEPTYST